MKSIHMRLSFTAIFLFGGAAGVRAGMVLQYGTGAGRLGAVQATSGNQAVISFAGDHLLMEGPNFWSCKWQHNDAGVDVAAAKATDHLVVEVSGETADEQPALKILLFSPDWSRRSTYIVDLSTMKKDAFTVIPASSMLGQPVEMEGGGWLPGSPVGHVMFMTSASRGLNPWRLKIRSLSYGAAPQP